MRGLSMIELIRRGILLGLGALSLTHEKAKSFVDEMVKRGEVTKDEGVKLVEEILDRAKEQERRINEKISDEIRKAIDSLGVASKEDVARLEKRIEELGKKIEK
jgi:poly(hydroxyalkanoate) granule-associated protein